VVSFKRRLVYLRGKSPQYPLARRLVGPQNWSGHGGEEKKIPLLAGDQTPDVQPITPSLYYSRLNEFNSYISLLFLYLLFMFV